MPEQAEQQAQQVQAQQVQAQQVQAQQVQAQQQAEQQAQQVQAQHQAEQQNNLETKYINQLSPMELIVLKIAKEHLQTSFDLKKSIGYKNWLKTLSDGA